MSGVVYDNLVKLLMLGDSAVGKTSLIMRFCEDKFDSKFVTSLGVDFTWKEVVRNQRKLMVQVWDTAGQEKFRSITPAYYRTAMGVVITYDVTSRTSFDQIGFWIKSLAQYGDPQVQRILVGNKSDLEEDRQVSTADGEMLAKENKMFFFETSAKTRNNVENAFFQIADQVVEQRYLHSGAGPVKKNDAQQLMLVTEGYCENCWKKCQC